MKDDDAFGGELARSGRPGLSEGSLGIALAVGEGAPGVRGDRKIGGDLLLARRTGSGVHGVFPPAMAYGGWKVRPW